MAKTFLFFCILFIPAFSCAEIIELKNGKVVEGKVVEETAEHIKIDIGAGAEVTYFKFEIKNYTKDDGSQKDASLPAVFTVDELTPEQKNNYQENYITTDVYTINVSPSGVNQGKRPLNAMELTDAATKLYKQGLVKEALVKAQEAIAQDAEFILAYRVVADILQETGSPDKSITYYDKILEKYPDDEEIWYNRGYAYGRMKKLDKSLADYNKSLELKPSAYQVLVARGNTYLQMGNVDLAKKDYEAAMDYTPEQACFGLGNVAIAQKNYNEAIRYYDKTLAVSPDFAPAYLMKGQALLQVEKKQEAVEALKKAKAFGMTLSPDLEKEIQ